MHWTRGVSALVALGFLVASSPSFAVEEVFGRAKVLLGDEVIVEGYTVRLFGVDAPDRGQECDDKYGKPVSCDKRARDALRELIGKVDVTCIDLEPDEGERLKGTCYAGDINLNGLMVRKGWAFAYSKESRDYEQPQTLARREKKGLWTLKLMKPWRWRKLQAEAEKKK